MFNEKERYLIDKLKSKGYGWAKFAKSVESQEMCTEKQYETMCRMLQRVNAQAARALSGQYQSKGHHDVDTNLSDYEAYESNEHF